MSKIERPFDEELKNLKEKLLEMAARAEEQIALAIRGLSDREEKLACQVLDREEAINLLDIEIDEMCLCLLALRQPMATDLRFITSAMKISNDLERIGDLAVNIAERTIDLLKSPQLKPLIDIPRMAQLSQDMVRDALNAFVNRDEKLARDVCQRDDQVDQLEDQVFLPRVGGEVDIAIGLGRILAGEVHGQRARLRAPVGLAEVHAVPHHVGPLRAAARFAGQELAMPEHRMGAAKSDQRPGEAEQVAVARQPIPVDPTDLVVLTVGVVVAVLGAAELVARPDHGRTLGQDERREKIAHLAPAKRVDRGIVGRSLDSAVP